MKRIINAIFVAVAVIAAGCTQYDDTELREQMESIQSQVDGLDVKIQQINANLDALQTIVNALDGKDYITSVQEVTHPETGVTGYTIVFAESGAKTVYNGKDSAAPSVSAALHSEAGVYCWQVDGQWLEVDGNPLPTSGATPQIRIENGVWKISYDGSDWETISVTGDAQSTVACHFKEVNIDNENNCVTFVANDGSVFTLPLGARFALIFSEYKGIKLEPGQTTEIAYTVAGADVDTEVYVISSGSLEVEVCPETTGKGVLKIAAPDNAEKGNILVGASDHKGQSDLRLLEISTEILNLNYVEPDLVPAIGGEVLVQVITNVSYQIKIDQSWLTYVATKAIRTETLSLTASENPTSEVRTAKVQLVDAAENVLMEFAVAQDKNDGDLTLNWVYSEASVTPSFGYSEPAIDADGNVYVISGNSLVKIASSGKLAWTKALSEWGGNCPDITPSLEADGSVVYTAGGTNDVVGVYAFTADGTQKWCAGFDKFFPGTMDGTLSFWKSGVAVGDDNLFVAAYRGHSINAFSKTDGTRTSYLSSDAEGTTMNYNFTNSPVLTKDGVVAAKSGTGMAGGNRSLMEHPSEDFKTANQDFYVPNGLKTTYQNWNFSDRAPAIAVEYNGKSYVVSGGTEQKSGDPKNNHHFHVWYQASEKGLNTTVPTPSLDYNYTIAGAKLSAGTGGGGLVAGAQNEVIVSFEVPAEEIVEQDHEYASAGFVAVWPAKKSMADAFAYRYEHNVTVPGSCAVDQAGNVHMMDLNGGYFIFKPNYESKTVTLVRNGSLLDLVKGCGKSVLDDATSVTVKSSVKLGLDGKIYVNATFKNASATVGATVCFSYAGTTGICAASSWPQAGADPMNTNRQVGYQEKNN